MVLPDLIEDVAGAGTQGAGVPIQGLDFRVGETLALRTARAEVTGAHLSVAVCLRELAAPLDVACSDDEATRAWMPALAGRALDRPRVPDWIRVEPFAGSVSPCRFLVSRYGSSGPFAMSFRAGVLTLSRRSTQDAQEAR